jgi:4-hydroxy-2-oxoheptanedioate aldolase
VERNLKDELRAGKNLLGCFVMLPSPALVEMLGHAGFDFLVLDTEHGAAGMETLEHQLRAADSAGIPCVVRTVGMTPGEILRALDAGAAGILVPHVLSADQARAIVSSAHYPPIGTRGFASTARAGRHGFVTVAEHLERARARTVVMVQIEDAAALPHVAEIAAVDHLDGVFIGPADLSMSMGHPGNASHPEVVAAIDKAARDIVAGGASPSIFARTAAEIPELKRRGFPVAVFSSTVLLNQAMAATVAAARTTS